MVANISDEELEEYQNQLDEQALKRHDEEEEKRIEAEAESRIQEIFDSIKAITDYTLNDNKPKAVKVNYKMQCFIDALLGYTGKATYNDTALSMKSAEIIECACDSFYLCVGGRYRTAYMLMRKMLELFAVSDYIDTSGIYKSPESNNWVFLNDKPPIHIINAIRGIDKNNRLENLYGKLCSFAHNDGTKEYIAIWDGHYKKEGFDMYAKEMIFLSDYLCDYIKNKK